MGLSGAFRTGLAVALVMAAMPAPAQFSDRYTFLKAVRDADGAKAMTVLQKPGSPDLDSRDPATGETALHIVVRRHDQTWLTALLARGAKTELRDNGGDTPLMAAAKLSDADSLRTLLSYNANANATDTQGQTALIVAVQRRDMASIRLLLAGGADPRLADRVAGRTAKDYAAEDSRGAAVLRLLEDAKPKAPPVISGPVRR